jgi:hypothetical protein
VIGKKVAKNRARAALKSKAANVRDLTNHLASPGDGEKPELERWTRLESLPAPPVVSRNFRAPTHLRWIR